MKETSGKVFSRGPANEARVENLRTLGVDFGLLKDVNPVFADRMEMQVVHSGCAFEKLESIEIDLLVNVGGNTPLKILRYGEGKKHRVQEMAKWWKIYRRWGMKCRS